MVSGADRPVSLAIDTSGSFCSVALRRVDGAVFHRASEGAGDHFERLSALVSELCAESGVALADVAEVVIGSGPGSFTGLRIGFSFAKGLAVARRLPIIGVSSFFGAAASLVGEFSGDVLVVADARRDEVFAGAFRACFTNALTCGGPQSFRYLLKLVTCKAESLVGRWCSPRPPCALVV